MQSTLLNPKKPETCAIASNEDLLASAYSWVQIGAPGHARDLCSLALRRSPNDGSALRMLAHLTENADVDGAHRLFRRASEVGVLSAEDYDDWIRRLFSAAPKRIRQAAEVAQRFLSASHDNIRGRARAACWLATLESVESAAAVLTELWNQDDLSPEAADELVTVLGITLESRWEWSEFVREVLHKLTLTCSKRGLVDAVKIAYRHEQFDDALEFLNRGEELEKLAPGETHELSLESKMWRALIAADSDDYERAVPLLRIVTASNGIYGQGPLDIRLKLILARCLIELGQFGEATQTLNSLAPLLAPTQSHEQDDAGGGALASALSGVALPPPQHITELEKKHQRIAAAVLNATIKYETGNFGGHWEDAYEIGSNWVDIELSNYLRAALLGIQWQFDVDKAGQLMVEFDKLRQEGGWDTREGASIEISRLEMLAGLARHLKGFDKNAENAMREASAVLQEKPTNGRFTHKRAYVALLSQDYSLAHKLLAGEEKTPSWRILAMQAHAALGLGQQDESFELCSRLRGIRPHDVRVRCLYIEAALASGHSAMALREAKSLVTTSPEHVVAHLLLAQCLESAGATPSTDSPEPARSPEPTAEHAEPEQSAPSADQPIIGPRFQDFVYAARHYAQALRLDNALSVALASRTFPSPLASDLLSREIVENAARKGAHAALQAEMMMLRSGLPTDKQLQSDGRELVARLAEFDSEEAKRLLYALEKPRRERMRRLLAERGLPLVGLASVAGLVFADLQIPAFDEIGTDARVLLFALAGLAVVWPHAHKLSLPGGVGFERKAPEPSIDVDSTLVGNGLVSANAWLQGSHAPTAPPDIVPREHAQSQLAVPTAIHGAKELEKPPVA